MEFEGYKSVCDYVINSDRFPETFKDIFRESKLFIIHRDLFINFHKENAKHYQATKSNINPYNPEDNKPQRTLNLPFPKIFIEPHQEYIIQPQYPVDLGVWEILGFLVEDNVEKHPDKIFFTIMFRVNDKMMTFPIEINKYLNVEHPEYLMTNKATPIIIQTLNMLGYNLNVEDIPKVTKWDYNKKDMKQLWQLDNAPYYCMDNLFGMLLTDLLDVIQYINCANSEVIFLGTSPLDYKKRVNRGDIPFPQAYTIYLKNKVTKRGYLFDGERFHPHFIFDVRGHFRVYHHPRYTNMQGKKQWINPFRRGSGFYVKKDYKLTKADIRGELS